jgi:hypothetical protein
VNVFGKQTGWYSDPKSSVKVFITQTATGNGDIPCPFDKCAYDKIVESLKISLSKNLKYLMVQTVLCSYPSSDVTCVYCGDEHDCDSSSSSSSDSDCCHKSSSDSDSDSDCGKKECCSLYLTKTRYPTNLSGIEVGSKVLLVVGKKLSYCPFNSIICIGASDEGCSTNINGGFKGVVNKYNCNTGKMLVTVVSIIPGLLGCEYYIVNLNI